MEQANKKKAFPAQSIPPAPVHAREIHKRVRAVIEHFSLIDPQHPVIIAVSGGPDSLALLHILSTLFPKTVRIAVYIDHGLRPSETNSEKQLVKENAIVCNAVFHTAAVDVNAFKKEQQLSTEEAARNLRYSELERLRDRFQAGCIAVGHTADDQAEEILLRLIRGSGCKGLSGMDYRHGKIVRPLLQETKATLLSFLRQGNIPFCEDSSNRDIRFLRNRIRLDLLPKLEQEYNGAMRKTLLQTASILAEDDKLLQRITEQSYRKAVHREQSDALAETSPLPLTLAIELFTDEPVSIQRRLMEKICIEMHCKPSFQKINSLLKLAGNCQKGEVHLSRGLRAQRHDKFILFHYPVGKKAYRGRANSCKKTFPSLLITSPGSYPVMQLGRELLITEIHALPAAPAAEELFIDPAALHLPLLLRQVLPEDLFHPLGAPGRKKVFRFLSDQKIPIEKRDSCPVLVSADKVVALIGLRIDHSFRIRSSTSILWQLSWRQRSL